MDCLSGLIGFRGACATDTPDSIFYVNDLPSISIKEVDAAINSEDADAVSFIQSKIDLAGDLITSRIRSTLTPKFNGNSLIENGVIGYFQDNLQAADSAAGYLVGKQIEINNHNYLELFISKVGLQMGTTGDVDVYIYDLIQNKLLHTITVPAVQREVVYVDVYKLFKGNGQKINLFIGYEYAAAYTSILSRNNCTSCTGQVYENAYARFSNKKVLTSSSKIADNLSGGSEDGLTFTYSVNCTFEPFICSIRHLLAEAIWWKAGELLVTEMRFSKRNNSIVSVYTDDHDKLIEAYGKASDAALYTVIQNMKLPDNQCFTCNKKAYMPVRL